jgi:glutathione S-transferase
MSERVRAPASNRAPDEARIAAALPRAATCLDTLHQLMDGDQFLAGPALNLADLHAAPMFVYFRMAPEGTTLIARYPALADWLDRMMARPSLPATRSPLEPATA